MYNTAKLINEASVPESIKEDFGGFDATETLPALVSILCEVSSEEYRTTLFEEFYALSAEMGVFTDYSAEIIKSYEQTNSENNQLIEQELTAQANPLFKSS